MPTERLSALSATVWIHPPSAKVEAKFLVGLVDRGVESPESLRNLIAVSPEDQSELNAWAKNRPELADRIKSAIRFRSEVLCAFDDLLQKRQR